MTVACQRPTRKYPNGRKGTEAGYSAHRGAKETPCEACRSARNARRRELRKADPEKHRQQHREWIKRHPERKAEYDRRYRETHAEQLKRSKREYYEANAEEIKARSRKWYRDNREAANQRSREYRQKNAELCRESVRKWHKENADHVRAYRRKRVEANPELVEAARAYAREYYQNNKPRFSEYRIRRANRKYDINYEEFEIRDIVEKHGLTCYLCESDVNTDLRRGRDDSPVIEHVIPLCDPETPGHVLSNVRVCHALCNAKKSSLPLDALTLPFEAPKGVPWNVLSSP